MLKKLHFVLSLLAVSFAGYAQDTLDVKIDNNYKAQIIVEDKSEIFTPGSITVYDKHNKELMRVESEELAISYTSDGEVALNVLELPYGEQSVIVYEDFNFDGIPDLALQDGQNSCYHGPSFQVYLADGKGGFVHSQGFTDLAQSYCGFFAVDEEKKQINTMSKSGCCWHWFYTFDVVDNKPRLIEEMEESMDNTLDFILHRNIASLNPATGVETKKEVNLLYLDNDQENSSLLFSFDMLDKKHQLILIDATDYLFYAYTQKDDQGETVVELLYPSEKEYDNKGAFVIADKDKIVYAANGKNETLSFSVPGAKYEVYNNPTEIGVKVTTNGKIYNLKGDPKTRNQRYFFDSLEGIIFQDVDVTTDRLDSNFD